MQKDKELILKFKDVGIEDVPLVGGKNAALGEMYANLTSLGINIPDGFAVTATAYRLFLEKSGLAKKIEKILDGLDTKNIKDLQYRGNKIRKEIEKI